MSVLPGARLGPYEIVSWIGEGGMGEVWKARDTRLGRTVAVKISKAPFSERFEREARATAALNHPNICTLHDVGPDYLVMEMVQGAPLHGPLPLETALLYAGQILDALEAAHRAGIVHRDLKPANILVTRQGIKLLDFGLAKSVPALAESDATMTAAITSRGEIVGTLQYMSPEQLQGKDADARSDIFAFGCVFYEMLTGKRAFEGTSAAHVIAAILERQPAALSQTVLDRVVRFCLMKDPEQRWQTAGDVKHAIALGADAAAVAAPLRRTARLPWIAAALFGFAVISAALMLWRGVGPGDRPLLRLELDADFDSALAVSPDGSRIAVRFRGTERIATRRIDQEKWLELAGTEDAMNPFFSPDGRWMAYFARRKLSKVASNGGAPVALCDAPSGRGGTWSDQGTIIAALDVTGGLSIIPSTGGAPQPLTGLHGETADATTHRWPSVLPGGKGVIFTALTGQQYSLWHVGLKGGQPRQILRNARDARFVDGGFLVYYTERSLMAVPFDPDRAEVTGAAIPLVAGVLSTTRTQFDLSRTGTLVYLPGPIDIERVVSWIHSSGRVEPLLTRPARYLTPRLSADGRRLAVAIEQGEGANVWVYDWSQDTMTPLPVAGEYQFNPLWSPDGEYIYFHSSGKLAVARSNGSGVTELLPAQRQPFPWSTSPAGDRLYFHQVGEKDYDSFQMTVDPARKIFGAPTLLGGSSRKRYYPAVSPDGRWLAFSSMPEISVQVSSLASNGEPSGRQITVSTAGMHPRWAQRSRQLFFVNMAGQLSAVSYRVDGESIIAQKPKIWYLKPLGRGGGQVVFDVAPDGDRVVAVLEREQPEPAVRRAKVLLNVDAELRRRLANGRAK
jgi:Tol biopolymer transport system component